MTGHTMGLASSRSHLPHTPRITALLQAASTMTVEHTLHTNRHMCLFEHTCSVCGAVTRRKTFVCKCNVVSRSHGMPCPVCIDKVYQMFH